MNVGYVDTSCLIAVAFGEPGAKALSRRLEGYDEIVSSNLLEADMNEKRTVPISLWAGIAAVLLGTGLLLVPARKS